MVVIKKLKSSSTIEAVVSVAIISSVMVIIFPFFGQVLTSNHRMEIIRGLHLLNEIRQTENYDPILNPQPEFAGEGISVRQTTVQDKEIVELYHITTEFVNPNKKVVYSFTEFKYKP
jgi:hypothetical protein